VHELSIALSLVEAATEEAARQTGRVCALHLRVGALSGVLGEALRSAYEIAAAGTPLEGSLLIIEEVAAEVYCPRCRAARPLASLQWFGCAECGTPTAELRAGKELELVALEVEQ
jgi:hydrogenase nickel incorporation protein HypA/HybF